MRPISFKDRLALRTAVELCIVNRRGQVVERRLLGENVITTGGRANMSHLLAGDDVTNRSVSRLRLGDAGHDPINPVQALPVSPTDTDLFGNLVIEKSTSHEFPDGEDGGRVTFTASIGVDEANGPGAQAISEVGLFDLTGRMMTHKTFGLITKTSVFGIVFRYSILM